MNIRPYGPADAPLLSELYRRSVRELGPRHYTPEQVEAWASLTPSTERLEALVADGRTRLLAADLADRPVAFADLEPDGHIAFFYCAPEAAGRGAAAALYAALESAARAQGLARLHAEASEAARRFFARQGFNVIARRDFEAAGVPIHNYAVEKHLRPTGRPALA